MTTETNVYDDRILHMSRQTLEHLELVRTRCAAEGIEDRLEKALDYLRTFSRGPEKDWHSELFTDIPYHEEDRSFICHVSRRMSIGPDLQFYMTIGMIWRDDDKDWSFHS